MDSADSRKILNILCNRFYGQVKMIVNKYSDKQEERDIVNQEEVVIQSIYRDFVDADIFQDFSILYQDNFHIIVLFQKTKEGDVEGFHKCLMEIVSYLQKKDNQAFILQVCDKYKKKDKFEWIFRQAVNKINKFIPQLNPKEVSDSRRLILELITEILSFEASK